LSKTLCGQGRREQALTREPGDLPSKEKQQYRRV